jgi:capsular exopolysaccharide synthesis family protein
MNNDKMIHPPSMGPATPPAEYVDQPPAPYDDAYLPYEPEPTPAGIDLRRYLFAILRYKWLLALSVVIGSVGAYVAWTITPVTYRAQGSLWIEVPSRQGAQGDVAPIRAAGLLDGSNAIELMRSYTVLDSVAWQQQLFVRTPAQYSPAFTNFVVGDQFAPGSYELRVGASGDDFVLVNSEGQFVQQGMFGAPIGENVGFRWAPSRGSFPPGETVQFSVVTVREAAVDLSGRLTAGLDRSGNFLSVGLSGGDPSRLAGTLNALMERHVLIAAELKRSRLDETQVILEEQLAAMDAELVNAEREFEEFRIRTINLPSDQNVAIAAGLQMTQGPVFTNFFNMRVQLEQIREDRGRLEAALDAFSGGEVAIERLEVIGPAAASSELRRSLDELVDVRANLRALQDRYSDDYPPIQDLMVAKESLEQGAIPRVVRGIVSELRARERQFEENIGSAAAELQEIPPRTIEEGRLRRRVTTTEGLYNDIRGRVETARLAAASSIPDVRILDRAADPGGPIEDKRLPLAAMVFFGCLGAAMVGALVLDRLDARFRYASDVGRAVGLDVLGSIPRIEAARGRRGVLNAAQALEAFRELRIHVGFAHGAAGPITLTVTSPAAGEGKSLIASNLAVAFAEVGRRTLLIDGDTRRGDAHRLLGRERAPGLTDYLRERSGDDIIQATDHENLDFLGCGTRGVSTPELLASPRMAYFMGTLKRTYDVIIVDSPPLASGGDPLILSSLTGNLAVVIRTGSTEKALTRAKLDQLSRLPMRILGVILNDVSASDSYHTYYTSYLPGYEPVAEGEGDDDDDSGARYLSSSMASESVAEE